MKVNPISLNKQIQQNFIKYDNVIKKVNEQVNLSQPKDQYLPQPKPSREEDLL